jgi:hypothetical protein
MTGAATTLLEGSNLAAGDETFLVKPERRPSWLDLGPEAALGGALVAALAGAGAGAGAALTSAFVGAPLFLEVREGPAGPAGEGAAVVILRPPNPRPSPLERRTGPGLGPEAAPEAPELELEAGPGPGLGPGLGPGRAEGGREPLPFPLEAALAYLA